MKTIIISNTQDSYGNVHRVVADVYGPRHVTVLEIFAPTDEGGQKYNEKLEEFESIGDAARKLREDMADALASELEDGEMVEAGDASWRGEPYPIDSAIKKLEELEVAK